MMRSISNKSRGCGTLVSGGCYARGSHGPNGILRDWTWLLGEGITSGKNLLWEVPDRQMTIINLPQSLHTLQMVNNLELEKPEGFEAIRRVALLDHVGSNHYTPYQFAREVHALGPSRRIPRKVAGQIAQLTPLPIVFTHDWMPVVEKAFIDLAYEWASASVQSNTYYGATWELPNYGFTISRNNGSDHWLIPVLKAMHEAKEKVAPLHTIMPSPLYDQVITTEQPFGVSWITEVCYITKGDETDQELIDLADSGIEPVIIEETKTNE